jgi:DNA adenine methylase
MVQKEKVKSPLRFPGSKSKVLKKLQPFLNTPHIEYREPFVGGGAIFFGKVKAQENWLNDKDLNISNFLEVMKNDAENLCELVSRTTPTIEIWQKYRLDNINEEIELSSLERAFRFLFFNRSNYSGIYNANPIGGINQLSQYKIDCRWNPRLLCSRILQCSKKLERVRITNFDFREVITRNGENVFMMIDPPYYHKGSSLYPVFMSNEEHIELSNLIRQSEHSFLLTIDDCEEVRNLYNWANIIIPENWHYTVNSKKKDNLGKELFITNIII